MVNTDKESNVKVHEAAVKMEHKRKIDQSAEAGSSQMKKDAPQYEAWETVCGEDNPEPHKVACVFWVDAISCVDTVAQTFNANIVVRYRWHLLPHQVAKYKEDPKSYDIDKYATKEFYPRFKIPNLKVLDDWKDYPKKFKVLDENTVRCESSFRVVGTFMEKMELESFPFDVQDITVAVVCAYPIHIYKFVPGETPIGTMREKFLTMAEWDVTSLGCEFSKTDKKESRSRTEKSIMKIFVKVKRRWSSYMWRMMFIMAIINFCTLYTFCIEVDSPGDRGGHIFTILLTAVAFQFIVQTELPKLSYLTYLDHYVLVSYGFIGTVAVQCFVLAYQENDDKDLDRRIFWIDFIIWLVLHIFFTGYARYCITTENKKLRRSPRTSKDNSVVWNVGTDESSHIDDAYWGKHMDIHTKNDDDYEKVIE